MYVLRKVYVNWARTLWDTNIIRMRLYASTTSYPVVDDNGSDGELVFEGAIYTDLGYVYRNLLNGQ